MPLFSRQPSKVNVEIKVDGEVVQTFATELNGAREVTIEVAHEVPVLPDRSPLHSNALNLSDIKFGMTLSRHNINSKTHTREGYVVGDPFRRGTKYGQDDIQADAMMVPVVTKRYDGRLVSEDWYLADMGVVPYGDAGHRFHHWNEQNYTLAVV